MPRLNRPKELGSPETPSVQYVRQQVEVSGPAVVLRVRLLGWLRELAATALVARVNVTPFRRLL